MGGKFAALLISWYQPKLISNPMAAFSSVVEFQYPYLALMAAKRSSSSEVGVAVSLAQVSPPPFRNELYSC